MSLYKKLVPSTSLEVIEFFVCCCFYLQQKEKKVTVKIVITNHCYHFYYASTLTISASPSFPRVTRLALLKSIDSPTPTDEVLARGI